MLLLSDEEVGPTITTHPNSVNITEPSAVTFSVAATGFPSPTYQWQRDGQDIANAMQASYTLPSTTTADDGAQFQVVVTNAAGSVTSSAATLTVVPSGGPPTVAWEATAQNPSGSWENSGWGNVSLRILLDGTHIISSGASVKLTLRGRTSESYTIQRVSLVKREGATADGVDSSWRKVTFGSTWDAGVTVPANGAATSDPIPFDLVAGQDVFVTLWVPAGQKTVYRTGGSGQTAWTLSGTDATSAHDWSSLSTGSHNNLYVMERLEVATSGAEPYRVLPRNRNPKP